MPVVEGHNKLAAKDYQHTLATLIEITNNVQLLTQIQSFVAMAIT